MSIEDFNYIDDVYIFSFFFLREKSKCEKKNEKKNYVDVT